MNEKHFGMAKMRFLKMVIAVLTASLMVATSFGCGKAPQEEPGETGGETFDESHDSDASLTCVRGVTSFEPGTIYVGYVYVTVLDKNGFGGGGEFEDDVFVKYAGANKAFGWFQTLRVVFDGKDVVRETLRHESDEGYYHETKLTVTKTISVRSADPATEPVFDKPIIYLYPEEDTVCSVRLDFNGVLTCTYPEYGEEGWTGFTASKDGTLTFPDGKRYYALYWEGRGACGTDFDLSKGFCVKGSETASFLSETLPKLGLSEREANEFIIYWLPLMKDNRYNLITFQTGAYEKNAVLTVDPAPDTVIRVFMVFKPLENETDVEAPDLSLLAAPERKGFTVVEWGGSRID
ncbi:MAG: hypothetical protein J6X47_10965 [Clostridia bacterium]|nr:hypothetical protein [Clostridia bacterium]